MAADCRIVIAAILAGVVLESGASDRVHAAEKPVLPGMTYESLRALPDWSGWWGFKGDPLIIEILRDPPPMKPQNLARLQAARPGSKDVDPDPGRFCRPPQFVGTSGGIAFNLELLFTPGRVTLTNESGLLRRIHTDGRALPKDPDETNTGTSIGHWEGQTLVVETVGINPQAKFPGTIPGAIAIGRNVRITERISLQDRDTLQFDVVVVAPDILTAPYKTRHLYGRAKQAAREISFCSESDRSIDPVTGKQRFDTTPPADLPPPPAH